MTLYIQIICDVTAYHAIMHFVGSVCVINRWFAGKLKTQARCGEQRLKMLTYVSIAKNQNTDNHLALKQAMQETDITVSYVSTNITQWSVFLRVLASYVCSLITVALQFKKWSLHIQALSDSTSDLSFLISPPCEWLLSGCKGRFGFFLDYIGWYSHRRHKTLPWS